MTEVCSWTTNSRWTGQGAHENDEADMSRSDAERIVLGVHGKDRLASYRKACCGRRALSHRGSHRMRLCGSIGMTRLPMAPLGRVIEFTS